MAQTEQFLQHACEEYRSLSLIPNITDGRIMKVKADHNSAVCTIQATFSQRDLETKQTRKHAKFYNADINFIAQKIEVNPFPFQAELHQIVLQSFSCDSKLKALVKKTTNRDKTTFYLEIWSDRGLEKNFNLTAAKKHGDVCGDVTFASLQWSTDCSQLLLIAQEKKEEKGSYFDRKPDSEEASSEVSKKENILQKGDANIYVEDWGEQERGISHTVIAVVDAVSGAVEIVDQVPSYISPGQCVWGPERSIIFVGWWQIPFRLGVIYCENRRSAIFQIGLKDEKRICHKLSNDSCAVHSPRLTPDGSKLIYLERDAGGPHRGCERLMLYDFCTREKPCIIYEIVQVVSDQDIPLFCQSLPQRCWLRNGKFAILHSNVKTDKIIVMLELATGEVKRVTHEEGCWSVLDTTDDLILSSFATPNQPRSLMIGRLNEKMEVLWFDLQGLSLPKSVISDMSWEKLNTKLPTGHEDGCLESVLISPRNRLIGQKPPLIVWPHGGPHAVMAADFSLYQAAFARLGFAILLVNYRGSVGFGERPLKSLLGKIGSQDVSDVQEVAECALRTGRFDDSNVFIFGGSHGGFLSAHLVGQFPEFYRACALRNPVINLPSMTDVSDIPDWCYTEAGFPYTYDTIPTKESFSKMLEMSPIVNVKKVKTPVMIVIGGSDARVPPSQGKSFYRALNSMNKEVKMLWYPDDCHPISQVDSEADAFINIVRWFYSHIQAATL